MPNQATVLIFHGTGGNPEENWFPWLARNLREDGHRVLVPKFPTPEGQDLAAWLAIFSEFGCPIDGRTVLVGHSLGPAFILALLERASTPALGTFLVAGFLGELGLEDFDKLNRTFSCRNFDWLRIKRNAGSVSLYSSDDDPYVPLEKGKELAAKLAAPLHVVSEAGHFNTAAGYTEFRLLLTDIRDLIAKSG